MGDKAYREPQWKYFNPLQKWKEPITDVFGCLFDDISSNELPRKP
jgi:hypothetical protein